MNRIILLGRLVRDPEVRVTPTERTVCTFTLAVDRPFTAKNGQREADFINIVTWNKTAELCGNSLTKGQRALVEGRLQIRTTMLNLLNGRVPVRLLRLPLHRHALLPRAIRPTAIRAAWKALALL